MVVPRSSRSSSADRRLPLAFSGRRVGWRRLWARVRRGAQTPGTRRTDGDAAPAEASVGGACSLRKEAGRLESGPARHVKADTGPQADPSNGSPEPMRPFRIGQLSLAAALAAATTTSGCASSGSAPRTPGATPVTRAQTSAVSPVRAPRLSILSPRAGAHTGVMVAVRVALHDAPSSRGQRFRYVLDQRLTRSGGARLTPVSYTHLTLPTILRV